MIYYGSGGLQDNVIHTPERPKSPAAQMIFEIDVTDHENTLKYDTSAGTQEQSYSAHIFSLFHAVILHTATPVMMNIK